MNETNERIELINSNLVTEETIGTMSPKDVANLKRMAAEISILLALGLFIAAIGGGDDDDNEERRTWFQNETLLQLRRFEADIKFYAIVTPDTWRLLKTPTE